MCTPFQRARDIRGTLFGVAVTTVLVGCTDKPTPVSVPVAATPTYSAGSSALTSEFESRPRFDLDVEASGSMKPGSPIHLTLTAVANFRTADGEIRLTLPEVAAAENGGWDIVVMPTNEEFRPHIRVRKPFEAGEAVREKVTLAIPEAGYYYVAATGYQHRSTSEIEPRGGSDVSRRDFWLWVDEKGGRITAHFDTTLFAPGARKQPGPRGSDRKPPRLRSRDANITCSIAPAPLSNEDAVVLTSGCPTGEPIPIGTPPPATATFKVIYADAGAGSALRPVGDTRYLWTIRSSTGTVIGNGSGQTTADGGIGPIDCDGPTSERNISLTIHTSNARANVSYQSTDRAGQYIGTCGGHNDVRLDPEMAHLFLNLVRTYEGHRQIFGTFYLDRIYAGLYNDGKTYYEYGAPNGELHIAKLPNIVFGEDGAYFAAHEYGHYFQDRKLYVYPANNGLMRFPPTCPTPHLPQSMSNFGCAMGEGFANWYAVVVRRAEVPYYHTIMQTNKDYKDCTEGYQFGVPVVCTTDGSIVEGAVAALLLDISDTDYESHDRVDRTPIVVAEALRTCSVVVNGTVTPYTGIDHVIWCLENRSPYQVRLLAKNTNTEAVLSFFNTRSVSSRPSALYAGSQALGSSDDFRRLWLANLYSKRPAVTESPVLAFAHVVPVIAPAPEPDPEEPTNPDCGTQRICPEMQ